MGVLKEITEFNDILTAHNNMIDRATGDILQMVNSGEFVTLEHKKIIINSALYSLKKIHESSVNLGSEYLLRFYGVNTPKMVPDERFSKERWKVPK